jgi:hypothetical protein
MDDGKNISSTNSQNIDDIIKQLQCGYTIDNFKLAVHLLYKGSSTEIKKIGDQFLCDFDRQTEAWDISIQVLNQPNLEEEAYYNASQIIKKKIRFDFGNYTEDQITIQTLTKFLIEKIIEFKDHKLYLLTNFCKCFSLLTIFAHTTLPDIIKILVESLNNDDIKNKMSLLLIFTYMAENLNDDEIVIDESYRNSYEAFIQNISDDVIVYLDFLIKVIETPNYKEQVIKQNPLMMSFFRIMNKHVIKKNFT